MEGIDLVEVSKTYESASALTDLSLEVQKGEFLAILGPSGCGKTTLLRCIAGLERPENGDVYLGGNCVYSARRGIDIAPKERRIGFVFQNYALYPHLTVFQNVAFGLKVRGIPKQEISTRVHRALQLVELQNLSDRRPRQLSGGQQQRVAVARTVVAEPDILLFDEPLSNLDPLLRVNVRAQIRQLHARLGTTSVYVTHDQHEAMILGDRVGILSRGRLLQLGPPRDIYDTPATAEVAEFTGDPKTNILPGEIHVTGERILFLPERDPYGFIPLPAQCRRFARERILLHVRPREFELRPWAGEEEGRFSVLGVFDEGAETVVAVALGDGGDHLLVRGAADRLPELTRGAAVRLKPLRGNLYDADTGDLLGSFLADDTAERTGDRSTGSRPA
ncbi:ABC transporter ATP-binding protein [Salinispira pacifica]